MAGTKRHRVLVVDDESVIRQLFLEFLSLLPVDADAARSVDEAEELLGRKGYDLVVSDFAMPGRNGLALLALVRERLPDAKVALVTGSSGAAFKADILAARPDFFLEKPVDMDAFLRAVEGALGLARENC